MLTAGGASYFRHHNLLLSVQTDNFKLFESSQNINFSINHIIPKFESPPKIVSQESSTWDWDALKVDFNFHVGNCFRYYNSHDSSNTPKIPSIHKH